MDEVFEWDEWDERDTFTCARCGKLIYAYGGNTVQLCKDCKKEGYYIHGCENWKILKHKEAEQQGHVE